MHSYSGIKTYNNAIYKIHLDWSIIYTPLPQNFLPQDQRRRNTRNGPNV